MQKVSRLVQDPEFSPLVAAGVEDCAPGVAGAQVLYAEHVHEEVRELPDPVAESLRAFAVVGQSLILEDERIVMGDHGGARSGRTDYVVEALSLEDVEEAALNSAGLVEEAGVEGRLPAAGLTVGVDHLYPKLPKYAHHAYADLGIDLVHVTRYEKGCSQWPPLPDDFGGQYSNRMIQRSNTPPIPRTVTAIVGSPPTHMSRQWRKSWPTSNSPAAPYLADHCHDLCSVQSGLGRRTGYGGLLEWSRVPKRVGRDDERWSPRGWVFLREGEIQDIRATSGVYCVPLRLLPQDFRGPIGRVA